MRRVQGAIGALSRRVAPDIQGSISLAEHQGGELTLTADAGGLELADDSGAPEPPPGG